VSAASKCYLFKRKTLCRVINSLKFQMYTWIFYIFIKSIEKVSKPIKLISTTDFDKMFPMKMAVDLSVTCFFLWMDNWPLQKNHGTYLLCAFVTNVPVVFQLLNEMQAIKNKNWNFKLSSLIDRDLVLWEYIGLFNLILNLIIKTAYIILSPQL